LPIVVMASACSKSFQRALSQPRYPQTARRTVFIALASGVSFGAAFFISKSVLDAWARNESGKSFIKMFGYIEVKSMTETSRWTPGTGGRTWAPENFL